MKATELAKELLHIVETLGDREVELSVAKQSPCPDQQYLVADVRFVIPEDPEDSEPIIMIRDWPY